MGRDWQVVRGTMTHHNPIPGLLRSGSAGRPKQRSTTYIFKILRSAIAPVVSRGTAIGGDGDREANLVNIKAFSKSLVMP